MKNQLLQALIRLASLAYQEKYILHATTDSYILPEDLVEDVASLCDLAFRQNNAHDFAEYQLSALKEMLEAVKTHGRSLFTNYSKLDPATLLYKIPEWRALQSAARKCLASFDISAENLTAAEIDQQGAV